LTFGSFLLIFIFVRFFIFDFKAVIVEGCSVIADWLHANLATKVAAACGHVLLYYKNLKFNERFQEMLKCGREGEWLIACFIIIVEL
jgi:hypothetical protein